MNKVILMGRLTKDPEIRYSQGENAIIVANYTLAVDRKYRRENNEQTADFIRCIAFGRAAEVAEKYFHKGTKIVITGRIQTGSYINRSGQKTFTTDVVVEEQEFAESKLASEHNANTNVPDARLSSGMADGAGFVNIPDDIDADLPFA